MVRHIYGILEWCMQGACIYIGIYIILEGIYSIGLQN